MVTVPGYSDLKPGAAVTVHLDLSEAVLFSRDTGERIVSSLAFAA
jgi:multiple sugar transport system ATP-binding protein